MFYGIFEKHSVDPNETETIILPLKTKPKIVHGSTNMKILLSNLISSIEERCDELEISGSGWTLIEALKVNITYYINDRKKSTNFYMSMYFFS